MITLDFVSTTVAELIKDCLSKNGSPTENRILILSPKNDTVTRSGIIIPGTVKEGIPRKGVVISAGYIDEAHDSYRPLIKTGNIVTYGMYAGKELEFDEENGYKLVRICSDLNTYFM